MHYRSVVIASLGALPMIVLALWSASKTLQQIYNPCLQWGVPQEVSLELGPDVQCRSIEATAETKGQAVARLLVIHGGIVIASVLGVLGVLLARPLFSLAGAALILLESIPLIFSFGWLSVMAGGSFLVAAREYAPLPAGATVAMRAIGSLGGLAALLFVPGVLSGAAFSFLWVVALLFVAVAGWRPMATQHGRERR